MWWMPTPTFCVPYPGLKQIQYNGLLQQGSRQEKKIFAKTQILFDYCANLFLHAGWTSVLRKREKTWSNQWKLVHRTRHEEWKLVNVFINYIGADCSEGLILSLKFEIFFNIEFTDKLLQLLARYKHFRKNCKSHSNL